MRRTTLVVALSAVLLSASAWADQRGQKPRAARPAALEVKVRKDSTFGYRLPSSFSGERCFEWRIRSRWDLCSR